MRSNSKHTLNSEVCDNTVVDCRNAAFIEELDSRSIALRRMVLEAISSSGRGHLGPALSSLEIISTLYDSVMTHNPLTPNLANRDVFILSKGHGCLALYAVLAQHGYFAKEELKTFCSFESRLGGHPEWHELPGVEFSTGSLGHGLAVGVGVAKAIRMKDEKRNVFVLLGDGELGEGSIWESIMHASKHRLFNLKVIIDHNDMQAFGSLKEVLPQENLVKKFQAFGFTCHEVNGHSRKDLTEALNNTEGVKPVAIIAHTIKGKGIIPAENSAKWHHKAKISTDEIDTLLRSHK